MASAKDFKSLSYSDRLLTYSAFAILGLANTVLPFIIFQSNYLIIPYPRWIVILIETIPALLIKLALPHFLHYVPYWLRPLSVGCCWVLTAIIANVTPPNVAPPVRIFTSVLASAAAATTDISMLGMLRYYGRTALAGWVAGTGTGGLYCAVLPFILTVWTRSVLRDSIDLVYCLTAASLLAFFVILPRAPMNFPITKEGSGKEDLEGSPEAMGLIAKECIRDLSLQLNTEKRVELVRRIAFPFMVPLMITCTAQAILCPGIARALPKTQGFNTFFAFSTWYGLIFQLGNVVARSFILLFRTRSTGALFTGLSAVTASIILNASFNLFSSTVSIGLVVLCGGLLSGASYTIIISRVVADKTTESGVEKEFCLQVVGAGETTGLIAGGLMATLLEGQICQLTLGATQRWCSSTR